MKFLSMYKSRERNTPPSQEEMARMGKLVEDGMKAGWLVATEGCLPSALGARVRMDNGKLSVTDDLSPKPKDWSAVSPSFKLSPKKRPSS
jgi:hypothetical protein